MRRTCDGVRPGHAGREPLLLLAWMFVLGGSGCADTALPNGAAAPDPTPFSEAADGYPSAPNGEESLGAYDSRSQALGDRSLEDGDVAKAGPFVEPGAAVRHRVRYTFLVGASGVVHPDDPPTGANVWNCRSSIHPEPVVLVHGTLMNQHDTWATLAPLLWNEGYCVYTFNYGGPPLLGAFYGTHSIPYSAEELRDFVDEVRERTGAKKVDLIGHSQGSLVSRYYLAYLGGAAKVDQLIGIAPSNHGSSVQGLEQFLEFFGLTQLAVDVLNGTVCAACAEQLSGSAMVEKINAPGDTLSGVRYTVLATRHDELVSPIESSFLKGAKNVYVQDECALDLTGHVGMVFDPVTLRLTLNALDPASARDPECRFVPWLL